MNPFVSVLRRRPRLSARLLLLFFVGCSPTCSRERVLGLGAANAISVNGIDCSDGLARCREGSVEVSELATIEQPCKGAPARCACPWKRIGSCTNGCVAERLEIVIEPGIASRQLCAPAADAGPIARLPGVRAPAASCEEGQLFRCTKGIVVACPGGAPDAVCESGCFAEGAALDDDAPVAESAATAILCAR